MRRFFIIFAAAIITINATAEEITDTRLFELKGKVKSVVLYYPLDCSKDGIQSANNEPSMKMALYFDNNGWLKKANNENNVAFEIVRNPTGKITHLEIDCENSDGTRNENGVSYFYKWNTSGYPISVSCDNCIYNCVSSIIYDKSRNVIATITNCSNMHGATQEVDSYNIIQVDEHLNWIKRVRVVNTKYTDDIEPNSNIFFLLEKRKIDYYE